MIFSSTLFIFLFLPLVLIANYIVPRRFVMGKNLVLLAASLAFYAWGEPRNILLMIGSIAANYIFGLLLGRAEGKPVARRTILVLSLVFNLGLLIFFKYFNFLSGGRTNIALPIGISFFTFQIMSYVIDVYRGEVAPQRNLFKLALYISLFPQLIAGPIVRYIDVEKQLTDRVCTVEKTAIGIRRFVLGFGKKVLISNTVALVVDNIFAMKGQISFLMAWMGAICYALQIYYDFSGYSDMAIGLGHMLGFDFLENFNYPYVSRSVKEFWRRWHMSLSTWFRDYLYIPLGGNRKGQFRTYLNLLIVFAATGFWHGASWNFIVWGLFHGLFLVLERGWWGRVVAKMPKWLSWVYTAMVVLFGWVLFRADTLSDALAYMSSMFNFGHWGLTATLSMLDNITVIMLLAGIIFAAPVVPRFKKKFESGEVVSTVGFIASMGITAVVFAVAVMFLSGSDYNPFIYFRF